MDEERYLILKMLEEGKITAEEASALIAALEEEPRAGEGYESSGAPGGPAGGAADWDRSRREERRGPRARHGEWFDRRSFEDAMEEMRRDLEKIRIGAMNLGDEVSRRVQEAMRDQRESWSRGGPRPFRHFVRNLGDVFSVPFGREMHEERFEKEMAVPADVSVDVRALSGDVRVSARDEGSVRVQATKRVWAGTREEAKERAADYEIAVTQEGDTVRVGAELAPDAPGWLPARCTIDYDVTIPAGAKVRVALTNGEIMVEGVRGGVELRSTNGDVIATSVAGAVSVASTNGDIELRAAEPSDLDLKTINGDILADLATLAGPDHGISTTRGDVTVTLPPGQAARLLATTMHGDIELEIPGRIVSRSSTRLEADLGPASETGAASGATTPSLEIRALFGDIDLRTRKEE